MLISRWRRWLLFQARLNSCARLRRSFTRRLAIVPVPQFEIRPSWRRVSRQSPRSYMVRIGGIMLIGLADICIFPAPVVAS